MKDTRQARLAWSIAITAGLTAIFSELVLRPKIERAFRR